MTVTQIDGGRQIKSGTIVDAQIASGAAIALSKLAEAVIQADGGQAFTAAQSMGGFALTNVLDPANPQDAATRAWVLAQIAAVPSGGTAQEVRTIATTNITKSGTQTINGVALSAGEDVWLNGQSAPAENGAWTVAAGAWARSSFADTWNELTGLLIVVREGTNFADTLWLSTVDQGGTLNTTAVTAIELPGPADIIAGAGITRTAQTIDVVAANGSITVGANDIAVTFATPAVVLGTAAASGSAASSIRSDATIAAFDATNPTASLPGDALATGSVAFAARRDHKHSRESWVVREAPSGTINGSNTIFTLANTPTAGTEEVFLNGVLQHPGAGNDYTISGGTITYLSAPLTGDRLVVGYRF